MYIFNNIPIPRDESYRNNEKDIEIFDIGIKKCSLLFYSLQFTVYGLRLRTESRA